MSKRSQFHEYRFEIADAFNPDNLPMVHLADYMRDLATLLGNYEHVHFARLDEGSTVLVQRIDWEALPKVRDRVGAVRRQDGPPEAMKAFAEIDERLAKDNARGHLVEPGGARVITFPGRTRHESPMYGPLVQAGSFVGVLIKVGGEGDPVPMHLQEGEQVHICHAPRRLAREVAPHIFGATLRVHGQGRWRRYPDGRWQLDRFTVSTYEVVTDAPLSQVVDQLREVPWTGKGGSVEALLTSRRGPR